MLKIEEREQTHARRETMGAMQETDDWTRDLDRVGRCMLDMELAGIPDDTGVVRSRYELQSAGYHHTYRVIQEACFWLKAGDDVGLLG